MQLKILRLGGSGARIVASGFATRGGKVLRRMVGCAPREREYILFYGEGALRCG
jgi:hypothetical protein